MPLLDSLARPKSVGRKFDQANTNATAVSSVEETILRLYPDV